jgi:glycosyltransferase involved in cell wall biosynthesis
VNATPANVGATTARAGRPEQRRAKGAAVAVTAESARSGPAAAAEGLTVIILAQDEARHIVRCIESIRPVASRIIVVDSGSGDDTRELAAAAGAEVVEHPWTNYAQQFNWAIDNFAIAGGWTMRLDADEVVDPVLLDRIRQFIAATPADSDIAGATVDRAIHFLGRKIRWGGMYPTKVIRVWRAGRGRVENRWMDEHVVVQGQVAHLDGEIADINLNSIGWWTAKHNNYATREAIDQLTLDSQAPISGEMGSQARRKRWLKDNFYARLPLGLRPVLYFTYRYFILLGFLDGWQGLAFHGLQGFWYRFLVDVKIAELKALMAERGQDLATVVAEEYGHRL